MSTLSGGNVAEPSRPPNFRQYAVDRRCYGCQRKLVAKDEPAMWFTGHPYAAVFGACCFAIAPVYKPLEAAA